MNKTQRTLYLDMDDVVADWVKEAQKFLQISWVLEQPLTEVDWNALKQHKRFYRDLPLRDGAEELVKWAQVFTKKNNMHLGFLTAIPQENDVPYVMYDKVLWAHERFPNIPVFFGPYAKDKHVHCNPGDILIDDRQSNCIAWILAGGIAHQYTTWENCKRWIKSGLPKYEIIKG